MLKVFNIYFLALLLVFSFPVLAQENAGESENEPEKSTSEDVDEEDEEEEEEEEEKTVEETQKPAEAKPEEAKPEEVKPEEVKPEEVKQEKPAAPAVVEQPAEKAEVKTEQPKVEEPKVAVKVEGESEDGDKEKSEDEKEKENKKFSVSLTNGFSHGFAKERKSFSYMLSLGASYILPWQIAFSADVGLNAVYRYDMNSALPVESGDMNTEKVDYGQFDGTPLNLGLSKRFPLFWQIGGSLGISAGLPFTSTELWEQYKIYTMLSANLGLMRSFKLAKETSVITSFGFGYTKTFAKEDYAWDDYQNTMLSTINEHAMNLSLSLALTYKDFSLAVGGGYNISRNYSGKTVSFNYGDSNDTEARKEETIYQEWTYSFSFRVSASYKLKDWNFGLGVMTNAPEYESGNFSGFNTVAGDKEVTNPTSNYPFKPKYTRVFANIGYSYSF